MKTNSTITAYIGIGSNLGDREANLRRALAMLIETPNLEIRRISPMIDNPAMGGPEDSPRFLNAAAEIVTTLTAHALLKRLQEIEQAMGRVRVAKWDPRNIDLDLLLYGNSIISNDTLIVPHPLMHERRFVLEPLAAIAPKAVHPALNMTIEGLLENMGVKAARR